MLASIVISLYRKKSDAMYYLTKLVTDNADKRISLHERSIIKDNPNGKIFFLNPHLKFQWVQKVKSIS